ncbi:MAG: IS200/IS605 family transposase [Thaumarchaeota archaeon]|nr:MAG: IS200/IS605 family transposase [Nitrososphaerota archaeon]
MPRRRHAAWRIAYHIVWIPKYRRKILRGRIAETLREAIRDKTRELGVETIALAVMPDHIHLIVSAPPSISPSELVRHLKGYTARRLGEEYPWLRRRGHIWARGYWVSTLGDVSIEKALNYVLSQGKPKALNRR